MKVSQVMIKNSVKLWTLLLLLQLVLAACNSEPTVTAVHMYPDQESKAFEQFARQCSICHRPPQPNLHTAQAWENVVDLMQEHRAQRGVGAMSVMEKKEVLAYLQAHSAEEKP